MKITLKRQIGNQCRAQSDNNQHCEAREQVNRGKRKKKLKDLRMQQKLFSRRSLGVKRKIMVECHTIKEKLFKNIRGKKNFGR